MLRAAPLKSREQDATGAVGKSPAPILPPLTFAGRVLLAREVIVTYAGVRRRLRRSDLSKTVAELRELAPGEGWREPGQRTFWEGVRLAKATRTTLAVLPTDTRCLMQSLVLLALLARREIGTTLIVAAKTEPDFEAHAWVEHDGMPLLPAGEYGKLVEL